jgi:hypothetical protein
MAPAYEPEKLPVELVRDENLDVAVGLDSRLRNERSSHSSLACANKAFSRMRKKKEGQRPLKVAKCIGPRTA